MPFYILTQHFWLNHFSWPHQSELFPRWSSAFHPGLLASSLSSLHLVMGSGPQSYLCLISLHTPLNLCSSLVLLYPVLCTVSTVHQLQTALFLFFIILLYFTFQPQLFLKPLLLPPSPPVQAIPIPSFQWVRAPIGNQ